MIGKAAKILVKCGAIGFGIATVKQQKNKQEMRVSKKPCEIETKESAEAQEVEAAWHELKENVKGMHEAAERLTKEFIELKQVADANGGKLPDVNEIVRNVIGDCEDKTIDIERQEKDEKFLGKIMGTYDDRLEVLRAHWSSEALMVDDYTSSAKKHKVDKKDLLPGEVSAVTFKVGSYTVRSALRAYKILDEGYDPEGEPPADAKDIARIKKEQGKFMPSYLDELRIVNEISARYEDGSQDEFTFICRAAEARNGYWREHIESICVVKENATVADSEASLFVLNVYMGDAFSADTWYKLTPAGNLTKLYLHQMNPDIDKERFV